MGKYNRVINVNTTSEFEHNAIMVQKVKLVPLVAIGSTFTTPNGTYAVIDSELKQYGTVSIPVYTVKNNATGETKTNVAQDYLMKFTGMKLEADKYKIADVMVGSGGYTTRWSVSVSKKNTTWVYGVSPASDSKFKYIRCEDVFGIDCLPYVESAVGRLVVELCGPVAKTLFLSNKPTNIKGQSCKNCKACRSLSRTDNVVGDANNPDITSISTFSIRSSGMYQEDFICGFTMGNPDTARIERLNKEFTYGAISTGTDRAMSALGDTCALDCSRYTASDYEFIPVAQHDVIREDDFLIIRTVGFEVVLDIKQPKVSADTVVAKPAGIKFQNGDLLAAVEDIIVQQVNCKGVMGAGFAKQIRSKWPVVYTEYKENCELYASSDLALGNMLITAVGQNKYVANLFGQDDYGTDEQQTDYAAFSTALEKLRDFAKEKNLSVALPYGIGCGLAGGDWTRIFRLIKETFEEYPCTIYRLIGSK